MAKKRFISIWRNKFLTTDANDFKEMVELLEGAAKHLREMLDSGKVFLDNQGVRDDYAHLYTYDLGIAEKYGFQSEKEIWGAE